MELIQSNVSENARCILRHGFQRSIAHRLGLRIGAESVNKGCRGHPRRRHRRLDRYFRTRPGSNHHSLMRRRTWIASALRSCRALTFGVTGAGNQTATLFGAPVHAGVSHVRTRMALNLTLAGCIPANRLVDYSRGEFPGPVYDVSVSPGLPYCAGDSYRSGARNAAQRDAENSDRPRQFFTGVRGELLPPTHPQRLEQLEPLERLELTASEPFCMAPEFASASG